MKRSIVAKRILAQGDMVQFLPLLWGEIIPKQFNKFIESMPAHCAAVIAAKGGYTYW
jgi:hypothetical protein